jgi:HK97 family phage major capsid protein
MKYGMSPKMTSQGKRIIGCSDEDRRILLTGMDSAMASNVAAPELRGLTFNEYAGEQRDMGSGGQGAYPGATSGFFIPVGFTNRIEDALKYYGPMLNGGPGMPEIFDTATGQPLPFPTDNDTTISGELIGEGQQVSSVDVSLSQVMLGAYKYSSKLVKVSLELLQDSAFDLESFLVKKFATRTGRILNNHFTVGTGTAQPKGIVVASTAGYAAIGSASNDGTGASTNTIGSDDLIGLEHSVDPLYRPGAKYMFHDATLRALRQVKDKYGRPLWQPGLAVNAPDIINGYGYAINNDMDQLQTQATSPVVVRKTVLFGQLPKYMIRRVKDMQVLRLEERFADYGQVAFIMFSRFDGTLLDAGTNPVKYLSNSY